MKKLIKTIMPIMASIIVPMGTVALASTLTSCADDDKRVPGDCVGHWLGDNWMDNNTVNNPQYQLEIKNSSITWIDYEKSRYEISAGREERNGVFTEIVSPKVKDMPGLGTDVVQFHILGGPGCIFEFFKTTEATIPISFNETYNIKFTLDLYTNGDSGRVDKTQIINTNVIITATYQP